MAFKRGKYHPGSDWAIIGSRKRKRSQMGKDSDVYVRGRKYTRQEIEKEIARHVPLGRDWCSSEDILPDYIIVCTPPAEPTGTPGMFRDVLLRDLPWYQCAQEINNLVSGVLRRRIVASTPGTSLETSMRQLVPQSDGDLLQLHVVLGSRFEGNNDLNAYLPPEVLDIGNFSIESARALRDKSPISIVKVFVQRFAFLSANNLLNQYQFNEAFRWIVEKGGADILVILCRLRSPLMKAFARKVFWSALVSGNISLVGKLLQCGVRLQTDDPSQRQRWTECLSEAVYDGHEAVVELLCKAGVRPEVNSRRPWPSDWDLWLLSLHKLLDFGADPERFITGEKAGFPLIDAALNGSLRAVQLLLHRGARVNIYLAHYYGTALQAAASQGHLEVAKYLIQHGAEINVPCVPQIQLFVNFGSEEIPILPSDSTADLIPLLTPVQIAAKMNNVGLLQVLLQQGASAMACPVSAHPDFKRCLSYQAKPSWSDPWRFKPEYGSEQVVCTALQYAALNQNLEIITLLLSTGVAPDSRVAPYVGDTPLQMSARLGNFEMFRLFWSWGADLNAPPATCNGRTAMQGAAESGNWKILLMLRHAGVQINAPAGAKQGMTALQAACLNGHSLMAGVLLADGAYLNIGPSSVQGLTPLQAAATHGDIRLVEELITLGAEVNAPAAEGGKTALLAAIEHESLPLLELLVQHGADINATGVYGFLSPLGGAASRDWLEGVHFLLDHGANVNNTPFGLAMLDESEEHAPEQLLSPLGWAIMNRSETMVDLLLQHDADVLAPAIFDGPPPQSALMHALDQGSSLGVIDLLLAKVPDLQKHPGWENALEVALVLSIEVDTIVRQRILEKVNSLPPLLRHQATQKAWDALPLSYGHFRCEKETLVETIELLIESGVSLDSRAKDGSTLVQRTACRGYDKSCSFLINRGAAVNMHSNESWGTPLQEAIKWTHVNIANVLLDHGADINALPAEDRGVTALQAASINGMFELAVRLLERGADVSAPAAPKNGRTAIDGAAERGHFDMVQLLLNAYGDDADLEPIRRQAADYAEREGHFEIAQWLREHSGS
ncbi:ankyrin repeat-containing domain protein [Aspergillus pseudotamarii]|uniref:Ankyrin repeat-containing domain protein n=1 Tax=Aspergillus pseudotamarii TaxID=132259 RepID=A0A5N6T4N7_ASPPS|nr:ankyrin repeat-containing domain protein [Aspergillus pseudotamarii]KAE8141273.1 ankyrin repeat-containing domain protein [Aspergillus pseudotamarii]